MKKYMIVLLLFFAVFSVENLFAGTFYDDFEQRLKNMENAIQLALISEYAREYVKLRMEEIELSFSPSENKTELKIVRSKIEAVKNELLNLELIPLIRLKEELIGKYHKEHPEVIAISTKINVIRKKHSFITQEKK